ncbi:MAG: DUF1343 domain-containing protein [Ruminococcaceae bacterium]|nr:DUF1343 domain-containing protein [Oscillospiraceae bacterium]
MIKSIKITTKEVKALNKKVLNGCDLLDSKAAFNMLSGKQLGLISNSNALLRNGKTVAFKVNEKYNLCALFSGEHGFNTQKQAGEFDGEVFAESETGVPVYDLFGGEEALEKAEKIFKTLDSVLFDIQDIGTRYYTYQYTLLDALKLCKKTNTELIILDRINPLGCNRVGGNLLESDCISEVGRVADQPAVIGMTIGEIAFWYNNSLNINANVSVISCEGLTRDLKIEDTDLTFIPPSPNMKNSNALFLYAGTCLFEGTNISEGRGTKKPFEMFGAPWLNAEKVIEFLYNLPYEEKSAFEGLKISPCSFTPTFSDYEGEKCNGIQIEIINKETVNMFETGLQLIRAVREIHSDKIEFSKHYSNLAGTKKVLDSDFNPYKYINSQKKELERFQNSVKKFFIY